MRLQYAKRRDARLVSHHVAERMDYLVIRLVVSRPDGMEQFGVDAQGIVDPPLRVLEPGPIHARRGREIGQHGPDGRAFVEAAGNGHGVLLIGSTYSCLPRTSPPLLRSFFSYYATRLTDSARVIRNSPVYVPVLAGTVAPGPHLGKSPPGL